MKSVIPWVTTVLLAGAVYVLYGSNKAKDVELGKAHEDLQQVESLKAENDELRKLPNQQAEITRLTKENEEVLRLRNEVQQLRNQGKQMGNDLAKAQSESERAKQRAQELSQTVQQVGQIPQPAPEPIPLESLAIPATEAQKQIYTCMINLRRIANAKHKWALQNNKTGDDLPTVNDLTPFLKDINTIACPNGGTYEINPVGVPPTCSVAGHSLTPPQ
jgi:outer membrane murein-binding lipoprotein Lpp